jgi:hypothetical protein
VALTLLVSLTSLASLTPIFLDIERMTVTGVLVATLPLWYVIPGLVIMAKRPWNQVGWLLIIIGLGFAITSDQGASVLDQRWHPWLAWTFTWGNDANYAAVVALLVVFPDGLADRSPKARILGRVVIGTMICLVGLAAVSSPVGEGAGSSTYQNPLGLQLVSKEFMEFSFFLVFALIAGSLVWMWRRWRRQPGEGRRRYTLVFYSFALLIVGLVLGASLSELIGGIAWLPAYATWFWLPVAFSIAVIRHGLYGLDRVVSRTVTYALVGAVVGSVYAVPVVVLPSIMGESNELVIAASTLAAAAVFNPVRRRVQQAVDHRFNRSKFDAEREVEAFSSRLRSQVTLDLVTEELHRVVAETVQPAHTALWVRAR